VEHVLQPQALPVLCPRQPMDHLRPLRQKTGNVQPCAVHRLQGFAAINLFEEIYCYVKKNKYFCNSNFAEV
jgi:hypothetical protein